MDLTGGQAGLTTLIFTDTGRGKLLPALYNLAYSSGSRLDKSMFLTTLMNCWIRFS